MNNCHLACLPLQADLRACRDNYRGFFEQCFAQLLKHIFGYDGSSWLDQAAQACSDPSPSALVYMQSLPRMLADSGPYREQDCRSSKSDSHLVPTAGCHGTRDGTFTLVLATYGFCQAFHWASEMELFKVTIRAYIQVFAYRSMKCLHSAWHRHCRACCLLLGCCSTPCSAQVRRTSSNDALP